MSKNKSIQEQIDNLMREIVHLQSRIDTLENLPTNSQEIVDDRYADDDDYEDEDDVDFDDFDLDEDEEEDDINDS